MFNIVFNHEKLNIKSDLLTIIQQEIVNFMFIVIYTTI